MLTGEPPFTGSTAQAVVARVLTETPPPVLPQRHTIPRHVEAAVLTALEKLPADRFATAAQFVEALQDKSHATTAQTPGAAAPAGARRRRRRSAGDLALAPAVAVLAVDRRGHMGLAPPGSRAAADPVQPPAPAERGATATVAPVGGRVAFSPDGRAGRLPGPGEGSERLCSRRFDQPAGTPIAGTEGAMSPFFSPDGRQVGFIKSGTSVLVASLDGAPTVTLTDKANSTSGDWGDDNYVYFEVDSGIARMRPTGGTLERIVTMSAGQVGTEWPNVLPNAAGVVFRVRHSGQGPGDFEIAVAKLPHGPVHTLTRGVYARYVRTGTRWSSRRTASSSPSRSIRRSSSSPGPRSRCSRASGPGRWLQRGPGGIPHGHPDLHQRRHPHVEARGERVPGRRGRAARSGVGSAGRGRQHRLSPTARRSPPP